MQDVFAPSGKEVIETKNFMAVSEQTIAQMRANKSRASGYQYSHLRFFLGTHHGLENGALARPLGRALCVTFLEPSLTVGLMPQSHNINSSSYQMVSQIQNIDLRLHETLNRMPRRTDDRLVLIERRIKY